MLFKFLLFSILCSVPLATTIYYDECGRPDYEKINESLELERREKENRNLV